MMAELLMRYRDRIAGVLSCFDRLIIWGSLPDIGYADAATNWMFHKGVRICEYGNWAKQRHDVLCNNAQQLAKQHGLTIQFLRSSKVGRKEDLVAAILSRRGDAPGLVCILSAMETCPCYRYYQHSRGRWRLRGDEGKCINYYFYFIDEVLGLCHLRVPTWAPFRVQFYCNGHNALQLALRRHGVSFQMDDNAFVQVGDFELAQKLADELTGQVLRPRLEMWAKMLCPVAGEFPSGWHWTLRQIEYSTDVVFKTTKLLSPLYDCLSRQAIQIVRAPDVARFVGKRLGANNEMKVSSAFGTRVEMTRIKHDFGPVSIKMYDKRARVLRIETTCNDVTFFKHYRQVVHRDGRCENKLASVRKTIYSLQVLRELMRNSNGRYLEFLSSLEDTTGGARDLNKISEPRKEHGRNWSGYNFFGPTDRQLLQVLAGGQWSICGFSARALHKYFPEKSSSWISRQIRRLRVHRLAAKLPGQLKYQLTQLGRRVIVAALALRKQTIIPILNESSA